MYVCMYADMMYNTHTRRYGAAEGFQEFLAPPATFALGDNTVSSLEL